MKPAAVADKIQEALDASRFDGILLTGPDNVAYASGVRLPFAAYRRDQYLLLLWLKGYEPVALCPVEWETSFHETSWVREVISYPPICADFSGLLGPLDSLLKRENLPAPEIGVDKQRIFHQLFAALKTALTRCQWTSCDAWLADLRRVKTTTEVGALEEIAYLTDHGINGAIHHVTVDRRTTALTLAEELRVHTEERGVDLYGYHAASHVASGSQTACFWSNPPKFGFSMTNDLWPGEVVRMKIQACLDGYWSDATRMMTQGDPSPEQRAAYQGLVTLREAAVGTIRPGVTASQVYAAVCTAAARAGIGLEEALGVGHGIGVSPCEPPFLIAGDETALQPGMVLVIDPVIRDAQGQIWQSKDTLLVTERGNQVLGWYKDWREPYIPIASI